MGWEVVEPEKPTPKQRQTLYRFGVSRKRVATFSREDAAVVIASLVGTIPKDSSVSDDAPADPNAETYVVTADGKAAGCT